jgi:hypothetical protein
LLADLSDWTTQHLVLIEATRVVVEGDEAEEASMTGDVVAEEVAEEVVAADSMTVDVVDPEAVGVCPFLCPTLPQPCLETMSQYP